MTLVDDNFFKLSCEACLNGKSIPHIIIGDFNSPNEAFGSRITTASGTQPLEIIESHQLILLNWQGDPTYISNHSADVNVLDLALCNSKMLHLIEDVEVGDDSPGSDHLPIIITLNRYEKACLGKKKEIKTVKWSLFAESLVRQSPQSSDILYAANSPSSIDQFVSALTDSITSSKESATKTKKVMFRGEKQISRETCNLIKLRRKVLRKRKDRNLDPETMSSIRLVYNRLNKKIRKQLKEETESEFQSRANQIEETRDKSKRWRLIRTFFSTKDKHPSLRSLTKPDGILAISKEEIAEVHANRLSLTHQVSNHSIFDDIWRRKIDAEIDAKPDIFNTCSTYGWDPGDKFLSEITRENISSHIKSLKRKSAPGEDGITHSDLKSLPNSILDILCQLFNKCFLLGYFPTTWKKALIKMLPKPGKNLSESQNYHPISLLSCIGKLYERCLKVLLAGSLSCLGIANKFQAGYKAGRTCQEHLLRLTEAAHFAFKKKECLLAVFLNCEAAFDAVWHSAVKIKLLQISLPIKLVRCLSTFLDHRSLQIMIDDVRSRMYCLKPFPPWCMDILID
jgi:hypothetical protein